MQPQLLTLTGYERGEWPGISRAALVDVNS